MMLKANKILLGLVALTFLGFSNLFAQDETPSGHGQIEGTVTDALSGETLIGVNVTIQGTSIGSATNVDGEYVLRRVPAGTQTIVVSYIGYQSVEETVEVTAGETIEYNVALEQTSVEGQEVVVSSQAAGQKSAINEQISSRTIKNVVSADKIRELPDDNAATALSRLPGISLQEGDKVVVRGMQAKMNQVMVNGISLPSTDLQDRSTNLGFISANMLSGIEVTKAVTPDMDANAIGGVVNLRLQEAPEGLHFDVMTQGIYNTQDHTHKNYKTWASVSNRFFDNKLGVFLQGNAQRYDAGTDYGNASWFRPGIEQNEPVIGEAVYAMQTFDYVDEVNITEDIGGSVLLDYDLPNGTLVLQNTYAYTDSEITRHLDRLNTLGNGRRNFRLERDIFDKHLLINALQGENDFDFMRVNFGLSHAFSKKTTDLRYNIDFTPFDAFNQISTLEQQQFTPDSVFAIEYTQENPGNSGVGNGTTRDEYFTERQLVGNLDFTIPASFSENITGDFKLGGKLTFKDRKNDVVEHFARLTEFGNYREALDYLNTVDSYTGGTFTFGELNDPDYMEERGKYYLGGRYDMEHVANTDILDNFFTLAPQGWGDPHLPNSRRFDYTASEYLTAGYAMADFDLGPSLSLLAGVRYEQFDMDYDGSYVLQTHFEGVGRTDLTHPDELDTLNTANKSVHHLLPNVQLRYKVTDWFDMRFAYTQTLSRPDYTQLMPSIFVDLSGSGAGNAGNPNLKPAVSQNLDSYFSFYNNEIGLFTIGGFYKNIDDVIVVTPIQRRNLPPDVVWPSEDSDLPNVSPTDEVTTFTNNPSPAEVYGFEVEWQTNFWYLPAPFNATVLNVNYTRTWSEMDYRTLITRIEGPVFNPEYVQVDTIRTARLEQQGNHTINVALGADYKGFSGRISFRLQSDVVTNVQQRTEEDQFTGDIYGWDFTVRQQLPVDGLSIFANGVNITHQPVSTYREFRREIDGDIKRNESRITYDPRRFELGIRYSF